MYKIDAAWGSYPVTSEITIFGAAWSLVLNPIAWIGLPVNDLTFVFATKESTGPQCITYTRFTMDPPWRRWRAKSPTDIGGIEALRTTRARFIKTVTVWADKLGIHDG